MWGVGHRAELRGYRGLFYRTISQPERLLIRWGWSAKCPQEGPNRNTMGCRAHGFPMPDLLLYARARGAAHLSRQWDRVEGGEM
jgi:hypothetical protein